MKKIIALMITSLAFVIAQAQHEHHGPIQTPAKSTKTPTKPAKPVKQKKPATQITNDTIPGKMEDTAKNSHQHRMKDSTGTMRHEHHVTKDTLPLNLHGGHEKYPGETMSHAFSLHLPMNRNGSGTGWLPDNSPMYGYMIHSSKWMYMIHGNLFLRYNNQDFSEKGLRGDSKIDAPNWFMFMGQRKVGNNGLFHFNTMFSLDAAITGKSGYPLLFQTGETANGMSLVDRQHPHDLFSELSVSYAHALSKKADVFLYLGYPGEPALGPVAFMHRPSALDNPNAPLSHHWVDATHITFGVATLGLRLGKFKIEGSSFTGREPDENRYDFDKARFDSWSGRLSFNPSPNWALQVSRGYIKSPEELHPEEDIHKTTASAIYSINLGNSSRLDATVLWGLNKSKDHKGENAFLAEGSWRKKKITAYTRYEFTEKSTEELVLGPMFEEHEVFGIHALTLGTNYDLVELRKTRVAIGGQWTLYGAPQSLNNIYGKNPMALQVYLRIYPALMK
jgi:hypothetical protein